MMKRRGCSLAGLLSAPFAKLPSVSHDGKKVAFISNATGTPHVYVADVTHKTIKQLTTGSDPITFCSFSPTKEILAYGSSRAGNERTQLYVLHCGTGTGACEKITPHAGAQYRFGAWSPNGARIAYTSNERNGVDFDAFVYDIQSKRRTCVHRGRGIWEAPLFSPSGQHILLQKTSAPRVHELYLKDLLTGKTQRLFGSRFKAQYIPVAWRRNGKEIVLRTDERSEFVRLIVYNIEAHKIEPLLERAADIEIAELSPDERYLAVVFNERGRSRLSLYHSDGRIYAKDIFSTGIIERLQWGQDSKMFAFDAKSENSPTALWLYRVQAQSLGRLAWRTPMISTRVLAKPLLISYRSFDGHVIPLYCFYPKRAERWGNKIPALVFIHGGPDEQYRGTFSPLIQYLVYRGFAVFVPNIRGSSGYGKTYRQLDDGRKKIDALQDVAELARYIQKQRRFLPPVIMGISYGGYVALSELAFYPELWRAGISSSGISNFLTYLKKTAPWRRALRQKEYGNLKKDAAFLRRISPLTFAHRITAPVLFIHGKKDTRVPYREALQIASVLKKRGVQVHTLLFKDEGHAIRRRTNILTACRNIVRFLTAL